MGWNEPRPAIVSAAMRTLWLPILAAVLLAACGGAPGPQGVQPVVTVMWHGGMCADGGECRNEMIIRSDGSITDPEQPNLRAQADRGEFARLVATIAATDLRALGARPFTGTCPTAFDGQEVVFTFRVPGGDVRLASCEVELDQDHELFRVIREVLRAAEQGSN